MSEIQKLQVLYKNIDGYKNDLNESLLTFQRVLNNNDSTINDINISITHLNFRMSIYQNELERIDKHLNRKDPSKYTKIGDWYEN